MLKKSEKYRIWHDKQTDESDSGPEQCEALICPKWLHLLKKHGYVYVTHSHPIWYILQIDHLLPLFKSKHILVALKTLRFKIFMHE